eukprot:s5681_g1.t1
MGGKESFAARLRFPSVTWEAPRESLLSWQNASCELFVSGNLRGCPQPEGHGRGHEASAERCREKTCARGYPVPPNLGPETAEEVRKERLLEMYREFALDLHTGMYLTQLTSNRDYADIHVQLMEDLTTLKLDQSNGRIIEFPLTNVSKVYRIVKNDDKWYAAGTPLPHSSANTEQIVVVEFMRRKLAFVFKELQVSQRFLICMELLIRRAQQKQALRSLTPTFPPQHAQSRQCPTPRLVHDAMARPIPSPTDNLK